MDPRTPALAVLLGCSACSWIGMTRPPAPPVDPSPPVTCTTSRVAPALDTASAVLLGVPGIVTAVYGIAQPVCSTGWCLVQPASGSAKAAIISAGLLLTGLGVMEAFAAVDGYSWASECEDLGAAQLACLSGVEPSCAALRKIPQSQLKSPGSPCAKDDECREGNVCYLGRCQVAR
jgi:hypothetical protein